jgi:hypothetical protein
MQWVWGNTAARGDMSPLDAADPAEHLLRDTAWAPPSSSSRGAWGWSLWPKGIETSGELEFLKGLGCQLGQGYLFSAPVPPEEIIAYSLGGAPFARSASSPP